MLTLAQESNQEIGQHKRYIRHFILIVLTTLFTIGVSAQVSADHSLEEDESEGLTTVYHVYYGEERIGFVSHEEDVNELIDSEIEKVKKDYEDLVLTTSKEVDVIPERVFQARVINDVTLDKLADLIEVKAEALALTVGDEEAGYLSAEHDVEDFVEYLKLQYVSEEELEAFENDEEDNNLEVGNSKLLDVSVSEEFEYEEVLVTLEDIQSKEDLVEVMETGAVQEAEYEVEEGDVLGSIAADHDLSVKELLDANPGMDDDTLIQIGDTIQVTVQEPLLHVVVEKVSKDEESIPYQTKTEEDDSMDKGKTEVKQEGKEGKKVVQSKTIMKNGQTSSSEVIDEETVSEPEDRIVVKGTKEVQQTTSRGSGQLAWPAVGGYISSYQGTRWGRFHKGIDIAQPSNRDILAAEGGTVTSASYENGYGNTVRISHSNGLETVYAHLSDMSVSSGQSVSRGQQIGTMGQTGNSTGIHLHFEVYKNGSLEDPMDYLNR